MFKLVFVLALAYAVTAAPTLKFGHPNVLHHSIMPGNECMGLYNRCHSQGLYLPSHGYLSYLLSSLPFYGYNVGGYYHYPHLLLNNQGLLGSHIGQGYFGSNIGQDFVGSNIGQGFLGSHIGQGFLGPNIGQGYLGSHIGQGFLGSQIGQGFIGSHIGQGVLGSQVGQSIIDSQIGQAGILGSQIDQSGILGSQLAEAGILGSQIGQAGLVYPYYDSNVLGELVHNTFSGQDVGVGGIHADHGCAQSHGPTGAHFSERFGDDEDETTKKPSEVVTKPVVEEKQDVHGPSDNHVTDILADSKVQVDDTQDKIKYDEQ